MLFSVHTDIIFPFQIVLNSMHRYQPRIHLVLDKGEENLSKSLKTQADLEGHEYKTFVFPEVHQIALAAYISHTEPPFYFQCAFYSVTAYQNQLVRKDRIEILFTCKIGV